jgi:hypothetical protein
MPSPLIDTPETLDAATPTAAQSRREKLLRIAEGVGTRTRMAYGFTDESVARLEPRGSTRPIAVFSAKTRNPSTQTTSRLVSFAVLAIS